MKKEKKRSPKASFISGLISAAGLGAFPILMACGPDSGLEQLAQFFIAVFICIPIIFIFGIVSLVTGFRVKSKGRFKWWLLPVGTTLALVLGLIIYVILMSLWSVGIPVLREKMGNKPQWHVVIQNIGEAEYGRSYDATLEQDIATLDVAIERVGHIDATDSEGRTLFYWSSVNGYAVFAEHLLEKGADPLHEASDQTALHASARNGHLAVMRLLIEAGVDIDVEAGHETTPLLLAAREARPDAVALLLAHGADVSKKDSYGNTVLHRIRDMFSPPMHEMHEGDLARTIKVLVDAGADVNAKNTRGETPLVKMCGDGSVEAVRVLLAQGANPAEQSNLTRSQHSALHASAGNGHLAVMRLLIEAGVDIDIESPHGTTPLLLAAREARLDAVAFLLAHGADVSQKDSDGNTVLHLMHNVEYLPNYQGDLVKTIKILVDAGADVNAKSTDGLTPLIDMCRDGNVEGTRALLAQGANPTPQSKQGNDALHYARFHSKIRPLVEEALGKGVSTRDSD